MPATEAEVVQPELTPEPPPKGDWQADPPAKKSKALAKRNGTQALEVVPHQPTMEEVLMAAVQQNASIETLERIQAMIERAQAAAAKREFFAALSEFQRVMPVVPKKRKVKNKDGSLRFNYAPIEVIKEMARPHLAANDLSVTTGSRVEGEKLIGTATANHIGGHSETREFEVPITLNQFMSDQQSFRAASSFAERCAYQQVTGIVCADEDNEARITPSEARATRQPVSQPRQTPTAQRAERANGEPKRDLVPAGPEDTAIDEQLAKGIWLAMQHAALSMDDFTKRFPKIERLGQIRKGDESIVTSWIADPARN